MSQPVNVEIRETLIAPSKSSAVVQLYISDAERGEPSAALVLILTARAASDPTQPVAVTQHAAMQLARDALNSLLVETARQAKVNK